MALTCSSTAGCVVSVHFLPLQTVDSFSDIIFFSPEKPGKDYSSLQVDSSCTALYEMLKGTHTVHFLIKLVFTFPVFPESLFICDTG